MSTENFTCYDYVAALTRYFEGLPVEYRSLPPQGDGAWILARTAKDIAAAINGDWDVRPAKEVPLDVCPFCRAAAEVQAPSGGPIYVECSDCGARGPTAGSRRNAIRDWNRRPECLS